MCAWRWITDWLEPCKLSTMYGVKSVIFSKKTKYQNVELVDLYVFGKTLVIDGKIQSSLWDEWIYHEALVHPVMLSHPSPKRVLVLGGGEGATLREVLRHKTVERAVMVDLDGELIEFSKKYMGEWHQGAFDDPRVELVISDGRRYLEETDEKFDVIIADLVDPLEAGPAVYLYTKEFYEFVKGRLEENGVFVTQATATYLLGDVFYSIYATIREVFPVASAYHVFVPCIFLDWGFVVGSKGPNPAALSPEDVDRLLSERLERPTRFYNGEAHVHMFSFPKNIRERMEKCRRIATDEHPVVSPG